MKKIFSILTAGLLGLMAVSCVQEPLATFDPTSATAPVLGTTEVGAKAVEVGYTPAVFTLGFNEKIAPSHALAIVSVDGKAVSKVVSSKDDGSTLSATLVNISKALAFFGYADGDVVSSLELAVRATLQNLSQHPCRAALHDVDGAVQPLHPCVHVRIPLARGYGGKRHAERGHRPCRHVPVSHVRHHDHHAAPLVDKLLETRRVDLGVVDVPLYPPAVEPACADHVHGVLQNVGERLACDLRRLARLDAGKYL